MKLKLTQGSIRVGDGAFNQVLYDLAINLTISKSGITKVSDATFATYDDTNAIPANKIAMDQATLFLVLANGGEMTEHLMYIQATDTIAGTSVPVGLPRREYFGPVVKTFQQWFEQNSLVWTQNPGTGVLIAGNPFSSNDITEYLTGEQLKIIYDLDTINYSILNETEKDALIVSGWDQYIWNP